MVKILKYDNPDHKIKLKIQQFQVMDKSTRQINNIDYKWYIGSFSLVLRIACALIPIVHVSKTEIDSSVKQRQFPQIPRKNVFHQRESTFCKLKGNLRRKSKILLQVFLKIFRN